MQFHRKTRPDLNSGWVEKKKVHTSTFEKFAAGSVRDLSFLTNGVLQSHILVSLRRGKDGMCGDIVVEVEEGEQGIEVSVLASSFPPIQPSPRGVPLALPLELVFKETLEDWVWASLTPEQCELRKALRWACAWELERRKRNDTPSDRGGDNVPGFSEVVALNIRHLIEKPRFWGMSRLRYGTVKGSAFFERRIQNNARVIVLVGADDDHELASLFKVHTEVIVPINYIFEQRSRSVDAGDLHVIEEAEKLVLKYLVGILPRIGHKADRGAKRSS